MGLLEIVMISFGLAMDAFAVSICKGLSMKKINYKKSFIIATYFGVFQAIMPLIGYMIGWTFKDFVTSVDHWIAFILLAIIGGNMIKEALSGGDNKNCNDSVNIKIMLILAIATSIDALAIGISFAFLKVNIISSVIIIGIITFITSFLGVKIGNVFGNKYESKSEIMGGIVLIIIGLKILIEHLGLI